MEKKRNTYRVVGRKNEGIIPLGRPRLRKEEKRLFLKKQDGRAWTGLFRFTTEKKIGGFL